MESLDDLFKNDIINDMDTKPMLMGLLYWTCQIKAANDRIVYELYPGNSKKERAKRNKVSQAILEEGNKLYHKSLSLVLNASKGDH